MQYTVMNYNPLVKVTQGETVISHIKKVQGRIDLEQYQSYTLVLTSIFVGVS